MRTSAEQGIRLTGVRVVLGRVQALDGVDLTLRPATTTVLVGPNGSGKSTLLAVLAGLQDVHAGRVDGLGVGGVALVGQSTGLSDGLPISVRQAITMGRWAERGRGGRITAADREVVQHWLDRLELASLADRRLAQLSGGQRQRTLVARGLAQGAPLVLLDEPTAAADAASTERIHEVLREVAAAGSTVVMATHDPAAHEIAHQVVALNSGRILTAPTPLSRDDHAAIVAGSRSSGEDSVRSGTTTA